MLGSSIPGNSNSIMFTEFGIPIRNLWHMLLYAWNEYPINNNSIFDEVEDAPTLDALLASILAKLIQQRLRIGLGCSYVNEHQSIRGIRGRIDFTESFKHRSFEHGQAYCDFQQYSANSPKNQIVRSTLARLIQTGSFGTDRSLANELRHNLRWTTRALEGVDLIELKLDFIRRQQFGRNDGDYRLMLAMCELLLMRQMPVSTHGNNRLPALQQDALILHKIYQNFVANFFLIHLKEWKVAKQKRFSWNAKNEQPLLPSMQPDIVLENRRSGRIVIIDTKFTAKSMVANQWGKEGFDSGHLYQLYSYLKTQEHLSEHYRLAEGILLYPAINQTEISESIKLQDQAMRIVTVDLTKAWQDVEARLKNIIEE
jgi:5-methylcytosine-specific restriction enzyme subunit McrC